MKFKWDPLICVDFEFFFDFGDYPFDVVDFARVMILECIDFTLMMTLGCGLLW